AWAAVGALLAVAAGGAAWAVPVAVGEADAGPASAPSGLGGVAASTASAPLSAGRSEAICSARSPLCGAPAVSGGGDAEPDGATSRSPASGVAWLLPIGLLARPAARPSS